MNVGSDERRRSAVPRARLSSTATAVDVGPQTDEVMLSGRRHNAVDAGCRSRNRVVADAGQGVCGPGSDPTPELDH